VKSTSFRGLRALFGYLWQHKLSTALGLLALLVADVAQIAVPLLSRNIIDGLDQGSGPATRALLGIVILAVVAYVSRCIWRYCLFGSARKCDIQIRRQIYEHAIHLPLTFHSTTTSGHIMSLATSDITAVRMVLAFALMSAFDAIAYGLLSIAAMVYLDPGLALITLLPFPILAIVMRFLLGWEYRTWDRVQASIDSLTEKARESISGMRVLRTLVQVEGDAADFRAKTEEQYRRFMTFVRIDALYTPSVMILAGISSALLLGLGGQYVVQGRLTIGDFAAFASFLGQLTWPMIAAAWTLSLVQRGAASMERILTLLEQPPEPQQPKLERAFAGSLQVEALTYRYPHAQHNSLEDIHFQVNSGASLGIVGEVGSGKSTLTRLLLRLYDPPTGTIYLDGVDIVELNLNQLRGQVAWVEQESFLFSQSIAENLAMGKPEASAKEVEEIAKLAHLHSEIVGFPETYQQLLGERGVTLSGGQKQRLCLARALLKEAPVLVLDDTLSAVDAETEHGILESLRQRRNQQTVVVISHRVSSVRDLDEIIVLEQGKIVQRGSHDQLLAQPGLYRKLYDLQLRPEGQP